MLKKKEAIARIKEIIGEIRSDIRWGDEDREGRLYPGYPDLGAAQYKLISLIEEIYEDA